MDKLRQVTNIKDIYIINLKERDERKTRIQKEMKKFNISKYDFFKGIEGTFLETEKLDKIDDDVLNKLISNTRQCHEELPSFNAIGSFYSHLEICKKISTLNDNEYSLVLEDDIKIEDQLHTILPNVWPMIPKDFDILFLGYHPIVQNENEIVRVNQFMARYIHFMGNHAYILSGRGAKIILNNFDKVRFQYCAYLRSLIENKQLKSYFILPPLVKIMDRDEHHMSDVQTNRSPNLKFIKFNNNLKDFN